MIWKFSPLLTADDREDTLSRPPDLDLLQSTPFKSLSLKTPPRVISLSERPLDFMDLERPPLQTPQNEEASILSLTDSVLFLVVFNKVNWILTLDLP